MFHRPHAIPTILLALAGIPSSCIVYRDAEDYRETRAARAARVQAEEYDDGSDQGAPVDRVDLAAFKVALAPHGTWIETREHGEVFRPREVDADWRPYTRGHWVDTTYGWTWISDWSWGWGPFHYGRWWLHARHGWCWVPGFVWGPAWVAWSSSDDFIGWAPLPPQARWGPGVGLLCTAEQLHGWIHASWWCFVDGRHFLARPLLPRLVAAPRLLEVRRRMRPVTNYSYVRGRVVNRSIPMVQVTRLTRQTVPRHRIRYIARPGDAAVRARPAPRPREAPRGGTRRPPPVHQPRAQPQQPVVQIYRPRREAPSRPRR